MSYDAPTDWSETEITLTQVVPATDWSETEITLGERRQGESETYQITGNVESITGKGVPFTVITWKEEDDTVIAQSNPNLNGSYSIEADFFDSNLPQSTSVEVDAVYYENQKKTLDVDTNSVSYSVDFVVEAPRGRHNMIINA